jgi:uncharacterized lipoprotein YddW (UPF0748 family)
MNKAQSFLTRKLHRSPLKKAGFGLLLFGLSLLTIHLPAQNQEPAPKHEFRGVWIATVNNIDYPRKPSPDRVAQQEQWRMLLNELEEVGFNAVIVQIRPAADAFYPSELAPWSKYLTGEPGRGPIQADFDPLAFMIEETHRRGMEFHAWMNPYRVTTNLDTANLSQTHVFRQHRDWVLRYGDRFYLNPGLPSVRQHLNDVVAEVVANYDVDAIHFDDYFYPYKVGNESFPDSLTHYIYGQQLYPDIADWRRSNIDALIQEVSTTIKEIKPYVKFGVSPFGVWRNGSVDPTGSDTRAGATCYDDLYADVLTWLRQDWIDYVIPQLYWNIGFAPADYAKLLNWWALHSYNQDLYIGHAAYKVANNREPAWSDPKEIPRQVTLNRSNWIARGSAFFSSKTVLQNNLGVKDSLATLFRHPALVPPPDVSDVAVHQPPKFRWLWPFGDVKLKWKPNKVDKNRPPAYYVIYRFEGKDYKGLEDSNNILAITPFFEDQRRYKFIDHSAQPGKTYMYAITAVNRQHIESDPSRRRKIMKTENGVKNLK